jgi:hypothetical protein
MKSETGVGVCADSDSNGGSGRMWADFAADRALSPADRGSGACELSVPT